MAADFLLATCRPPHRSDGTPDLSAAARAVMAERIGALSAERIGELAETTFGIDDVDDEDLAAEVRRRLLAAMDRVFFHAEAGPGGFAVLELDGHGPLYVSGGESYGDSPTDACNDLWAIAASGVTERPLTDGPADEAFDARAWFDALQDPAMVGTSEYHAVHGHLADVIAGAAYDTTSPVELAALLRCSLDEIVTTARQLRKGL